MGFQKEYQFLQRRLSWIRPTSWMQILEDHQGLCIIFIRRAICQPASMLAEEERMQKKLFHSLSIQVVGTHWTAWEANCRIERCGVKIYSWKYFFKYTFWITLESSGWDTLDSLGHRWHEGRIVRYRAMNTEHWFTADKMTQCALASNLLCQLSANATTVILNTLNTASCVLHCALLTVCTKLCTELSTEPHAARNALKKTYVYSNILSSTHQRPSVPKIFCGTAC